MKDNGMNTMQTQIVSCHCPHVDMSSHLSTNFFPNEDSTVPVCKIFPPHLHAQTSFHLIRILIDSPTYD